MAAAAPIHIQPSHEGLLHQKMGIPKNKKISVGALMQQKAKAKRTGDPALMKEATFAINSKDWNS